MSEGFFTFFGIYLLCLIKFFAGPILGAAAGYSPWEIIGVSVLGMMTSVTFFTFLGTRVKQYLQVRSTKQKKVFTKKNRRIVRIWSSYGEIGIAALRHIDPGILRIRQKENLRLHANKWAHLGGNLQFLHRMVIAISPN